MHYFCTRDDRMQKNDVFIVDAQDFLSCFLTVTVLPIKVESWIISGLSIAFSVTLVIVHKVRGISVKIRCNIFLASTRKSTLYKYCAGGGVYINHTPTTSCMNTKKYKIICICKTKALCSFGLVGIWARNKSIAAHEKII